MSSAKAQIALDRIAIGLSVACMVHCAITPIAFSLFPAIAGSFLREEAFHWALLWLILPSSIVAATLGCRKHKDWLVILTACAGLGLLLFAALFGHDVLGEWGERALTVVGGGVLAAGHVRNYVLCRAKRCCH